MATADGKHSARAVSWKLIAHTHTHTERDTGSAVRSTY